MRILALNPSRHHPAFLFECGEIAEEPGFPIGCWGLGGKLCVILGRHSDTFISWRLLVKLA